MFVQYVQIQGQRLGPFGPFYEGKGPKDLTAFLCLLSPGT